jgi:hypothetical protein
MVRMSAAKRTLRPLPLLLLPLLAVLLGACQSSPTKRLERLYDQATLDIGDPASRSEQRRTNARRAERVLEAIEVFGELEAPTPLDRLRAAVILMDSTEVDHLEIARDLALAAAQEGDERGFRLAAEATDLWLMSQDLAQWYCTQYVYTPITGTWSLYPYDPSVTDERRRQMGVPTLAEALARLDELNAGAYDD